MKPSLIKIINAGICGLLLAMMLGYLAGLIFPNIFGMILGFNAGYFVPRKVFTWLLKEELQALQSESQKEE